MPAIVHDEADQAFRGKARAMGLDPDNRWIGSYVEYEWLHGRHFITAYAPDVSGAKVLEFGCNVGATATVLALLGAEITGLDIDARYVELAAMNARRHGAMGARFAHLPPGSALDFAGASFDLITCNSVLEYVAADDVRRNLRELDRVLKPGGMLLVLGTSNRLWPHEVHSRRWLINYLPRRLDRVFGEQQRGILPWSITAALPGYRDRALADKGAAYLAAHRKAGASRPKLWLLSLLAAIGGACGVSVGMMMPSAFLALEKPVAPS